MDSFSKIPLSAQQAQDILAGHFGTGCRLRSFEELREGFFNAAALLELEDGSRLVMKAAPPDEVRVLRYEKNLMKAEVEAMRLVRQRTGVPVPEILVYDTSRQFVKSDFFLMDWLPGLPLHKARKQFPAEVQLEIDQKMGRMTRELSGITNEAFGYWVQPEPVGTSWRDCFAHMLNGVLQDGLDLQVDLNQPYEAIFRQLERHFGVLDAVQTPRLVHWDLWDGNVFVNPETGQITGLIDFERVLWADPLMEAIFAGFHPDGGFIAGYGENFHQDASQATRRRLYNVYLFLIMVIECYFRKYPTQDQENWARGRLREELEQLNRL
jgi:aminoglycoside phosphotransferase (APT) family kinase protein